MTRIGRNEPCPCFSGLKYKRCCEDKIDWSYFAGRPLSDQVEHLTLRGRNLLFLQMMFEALELDPQSSRKSLVEFKRAFTPRAVRKIYENINIFWPSLKDYENRLSREAGSVSGLYTGSYEPDTVCRAVSRHTLYSDKILLTDPFLNPKIVSDQFNPILHPEKHRATCLMNATLWVHMAPWIAAGLVNFVRPVRDFHKNLWSKMLEIQKQRIDSHPEIGFEIERMAKNAVRDMSATDGGMTEYHMLSYPDSFWNDIHQKNEDGGNESSDFSPEEFAEYLRRRRDNHPYYLDSQALVDGQFLQSTTGSCYEEAKIMCQIGNIHIITDLKSRWMEYEIDRKQHGEEGRGWSAFAKAFQNSQLKVLNNIPLEAALSLREEGRLENMRGFLRRVWKSSKSGEDLSEENAENFTSELGQQIADANEEFKSIDRNLLKWFGGQAAAFAAAGQLGMMPALATSAITGAVGLLESRMQRKSFASKYPAGFFLNIK